MQQPASSSGESAGIGGIAGPRACAGSPAICRSFTALATESTYNAQRRLQGQSDLPELSELGRRQSRAAGAALAAFPIEAISSSPLRRAMQTAQPAALAKLLQEFGADKGNPTSTRHPRLVLRWGRHFDARGEYPTAFLHRVRECLRRLERAQHVAKKWVAASPSTLDAPFGGHDCSFLHASRLKCCAGRCKLHAVRGLAACGVRFRNRENAQELASSPSSWQDFGGKPTDASCGVR
ncbi:MAG: histidine phosphatase family protein [Thermoguttaceae bacterium]